MLYPWESSANVDASPGLDKTRRRCSRSTRPTTSAPPELGVMEREIKRVRNGRYLLVPGSADTAGHGSTGMARLYRKELEELLRSAPKR